MSREHGRKITRTKGDRWCEVEISIERRADRPDQPRLSICGSYGQTKHERGAERYRCSDGITRDLWGCGQCVDQIAEFFPELAPAMPWHLNDLQAGCEHQRATWNTTEPIELTYYGLTTEASKLRHDTMHAAALAQIRGTAFEPTPTARALVELTDWYLHKLTPPDADSPLSGCYEVKKRETKNAGWIPHTDHPRGLLSKPCEVCGYKYGTAWLYAPIPADVLALVERVIATGAFA